MRTHWTDDRTDVLKRLWAEGKSAQVIADEIGDVTRNAVVGKAHRLGLSARPSPIKRKKPKPRAYSGGSHAKCEWPFGDPGQADFYFCGRRTVRGRPYCAEHLKRSIRKVVRLA